MEQDKVHPEFSKAAKANQSSFRLIAAIIFCLASIIPTFVEAEAEKEQTVEPRIDVIAINNRLNTDSEQLETSSIKN